MADEPIAPPELAPAAPAPPAAPSPAPAPTPSPSPAPLGDWRQSLPEDIRTDKLWDKVKANDSGEALNIVSKFYVEAEKRLGVSVTLPAKDAKPEQLAEWRKQNLPKLAAAGIVPAGAPAKAEEYVFDTKAVESLPGLPPINDTVQAYWKQAFHDAGLSPEQAQKLFVAEGRRIHQGLRMMDEESQKALDAVEEKWGKPLFDRRWALANRAVEKAVQSVGLEWTEAKKFLDTTRQGNNPVLFQILAGVGEMIDEDIGIDGTSLSLLSSEGAKAKIEAIRTDKQHPWHNERHPRHADAVKEFEDLNRLAYGSQRVGPGGA